LLTVLPLALLTIGSGLRLLWITSAGLTAAYFSTPSGQAYTLSGQASIVAFLLGFFVTRPATARLGALTQRPAEGPADSQGAAVEIAGLRRRVALSGAVVTFLLIAAAVRMAVARYV